MQLLAEAN